MQKLFLSGKAHIFEKNLSKLMGLIDSLLDAKTDDDFLKHTVGDLSAHPVSLMKLVFTGNNAEKISRILKVSGWTHSHFIDVVCSLLVYSQTIDGSGDTPMRRWLASSQRTPRDGQDQFYANLRTSFDGKVGLCEASTGSGKTTAILSALCDQIRGSGQRGLIATPAVALVRDFAIEHTRLGADTLPLRIFFGMNEFVSKSDLLALLDDWQGDPAQHAAIHVWLRNNAPSLEVGITHHFLKHSLRIVSPDFPVEEVSLRDTEVDDDEGMVAYRGQFSNENFHIGAEEILLCTHAMLAVDLRMRLASSSRDESLTDDRKQAFLAWEPVKAAKNAVADAEKSLGKLKADGSDAFEAEETLATAKCVFEETLKKARSKQAIFDDKQQASTKDNGRLPVFKYLVIDEAHLLEQSFSNSLSNYVAIHQFMLHARSLAQNGLFLKGAVADIESAYHVLKEAINKEDSDFIQVSKYSDAISFPLEKMVAAGKRGLSKVSAKRMATLSTENVSQLSGFRNDLDCIQQAATSIAGQLAYLNLSPQLAYPRLFVGKSSVESYLKFLWGSVTGAACVSATLYLPKDDDFSSWYMQTMLAIPMERNQDFPPVIPAWIRDTISAVIMPSCELVDGVVPLRPSSRGDRLSDEEKEVSDRKWCEDVADRIGGIYRSAPGGCLVLLTSYSYVYKIKASLSLMPDIAPYLVCAQQGEGEKRGVTLEEQRKKFLMLSAEGKKPVWLALGNAWTGINLSGGDPLKDVCGIEIPADVDNVLTDLIIPRLPFGLNKTITHTHRTTNARTKKIPWERIEMLLRLRQGAGRLVRRFGVPQNRRIHILDGRLCEGILSGMMNTVKKAVGYK